MNETDFPSHADDSKPYATSNNIGGVFKLLLKILLSSFNGSLLTK